MLVKSVSVKWVDSYNLCTGWTPIDSLDTVNKFIYSVGMLIFEDDDKIILTTSVADGGAVCSPLAIPKKCIIEMKSDINKAFSIPIGMDTQAPAMVGL